jgi:hypothetical protein
MLYPIRLNERNLLYRSKDELDFIYRNKFDLISISQKEIDELEKSFNIKDSFVILKDMKILLRNLFYNYYRNDFGEQIEIKRNDFYTFLLYKEDFELVMKGLRLFVKRNYQGNLKIIGESDNLEILIEIKDKRIKVLIFFDVITKMVMFQFESESDKNMKNFYYNLLNFIVENQPYLIMSYDLKYFKF